MIFFTLIMWLTHQGPMLYNFLLPQFTNVSGAPLQGRLLAWPTNIRLRRKGLPGTSSSLSQTLINYGRNFFITLGPDRDSLYYFTVQVKQLSFWDFFSLTIGTVFTKVLNIILSLFFSQRHRNYIKASIF